MFEFDERNFENLPTIKDLRHEANLSANKLARQLDVHERTVYNWESKGRLIGLKEAFKVAAFFGRSVYDINWWPPVEGASE